MFELKEYQAEALKTFEGWRDALEKARIESEEDIADREKRGRRITDEMREYPRAAWEELRASGGIAETAGNNYVSRSNSVGEPIPHICLKVPTGGGKTLLAAAALERLNRPTGLTLWMVPTRAIYDQTKAALWNREHPYRQMLERASGGNVKVLKKDDNLTLYDVQNYLCVMLITLQGINRKSNPDFLRLNRDSGDYLSFFPDGDDLGAHDGFLNLYPKFRPDDGAGLPIQQSLRNVIRMCQPVIILDEAHKAYKATSDRTDRLVGTVNSLDPSMVIELSATPDRRVSNILVDIPGTRLHREEMIKLPIRVIAESQTDWQHTLTTAHAKLEELQADADSLQNAEDRYIRPIAVVRVENTGEKQRGKGTIHSEDVRDYLVQQLGVKPEEVAVKASKLDELRGTDLLSEYSPVRWVITRAALMEGWDCPFASVLVMLDNTQSRKALTQLVGRVMRQPHTQLTGYAKLDECYVICSSTPVGTVIEQVRYGLEHEGLTGLEDYVFGGGGTTQRVTVTRRQEWRGKNIFLPKVMHKAGQYAEDEWEELDFHRHLLSAVDWDAITAPDPQDAMPEPASQDTVAIHLDEVTGIRSQQGPSNELDVEKRVTLDWFARGLTDIVPNAWQASRIAADFLRKLGQSGLSENDIFDRRSRYFKMLRDGVRAALDEESKAVFHDKLNDGDISFDLTASKYAFQLKETYDIPMAGRPSIMTGNDGQQLRLNLYEPAYEQHFNPGLEQPFARYLDEQKAIQWWHRVAVRQGGDYFVRGWREDRIWPDFVAIANTNYGQPHLLVFETKGEHLRGTDDTEYKKKVLTALQTAFNTGTPRGTFTVRDGPAMGTFRLVFDGEFDDAMTEIH